MTPITELPFKPHGWWRRVWQTLLVFFGLASLATGGLLKYRRRPLLIFTAAVVAGAVLVWWVWE